MLLVYATSSSSSSSSKSKSGKSKSSKSKSGKSKPETSKSDKSQSENSNSGKSKPKELSKSIYEPKTVEDFNTAFNNAGNKLLVVFFYNNCDLCNKISLPLDRFGNTYAKEIILVKVALITFQILIDLISIQLSCKKRIHFNIFRLMSI